MITCKNDRLLELLWFVGYCIEFPTQLAVRIGGGAEWNRRVMYRAIREGYDVNSEQRTVDRFNRRWILCEECGEIKQDTQMAIYGGVGGINRGVCSSCSRNERGD